MNMPCKLTENALEMMFSGNTGLKPVLQVTDIRSIHTQHSTAERYRLLLSDGSCRRQGMLATQCNNLVRNQQLQIGSIVQLNQYQVNSINDRT